MVDEINVIDSNESAPGGWMVLLFSFLTCGIYMLYWQYMAGKTLAKVNGGSDNGVLFIILNLFCLGLVNYCIMQNDINRYNANR